ncbi:MAG: UDP-N-acetylmuramate dehydrogenase, partial [bacterium]
MKNKVFREIKKILPGVKTGILLKGFTSYKIGGQAKYFFIAKNKEDLIRAIKTAKDFKLPIFILGGGSNLLISDKGFNGLAIKVEILKVGFKGNKAFVGAGTSLTKMAYSSAKKGLSGLEWAAGVPGTIGGAIYGHAQAFGTKISNIIKNVEAINLNTLKIKNFPKKQCKFSLKNSVFKRTKNLVIVSALLEFKKKSPHKIKNKIKEHTTYRKKRHPMSSPSAGSTFVNPEVIIKNKNLLIKFPELAEYNKKGAIPAGYLIKKCGLAGKKIGKAKISEKHANFIINLGGAKASDVLKLIKLARKKVKKSFNID